MAPNRRPGGATTLQDPRTKGQETAMKTLALSLALLAAAGPALAAGDNPPPGLLAKIQVATQAHQNADAHRAGRGFKDMMKFARENEPAHDGGNDSVSQKKHGSLDISKLHDSPRTPAAIGKGIGGHADDGDDD
jgi:hypothetical protein